MTAKALFSRQAIAPAPPPIPHIYWGGHALPVDRNLSHFFIMGATRSGKTTLLRLMMQDALVNWTRGGQRRARAIIYDPNTDVVPLLVAMGIPESRIKILYPLDARSYAWDMCHDIRSKVDAEALAELLMHDTETKQDDWFSKAARTILAAAIVAFQTLFPESWTFRQLVLTVTNPERLRLLLERVPQSQGLLENYGGDARTLGNLVATIDCKFRGHFSTVAALWTRAEREGRTVSLRAWQESDDILILGRDIGGSPAFQVLNQLIFSRCSQLLQSRHARREPDRDRTWVFLDEFGSLAALTGNAPMPGLTELLANGAKFGVSVVLGVQDVGQVQDGLGGKRLDTIAGACRNRAFLPLADAPSMEWASKLFGEQERIYRLRTWADKGVSRSEQRSTAPLILPSEFAQPFEVDRDGLRGFFASLKFGIQKVHIPPNELFSRLAVGSVSVEAAEALRFQERPIEEQLLEEFDTRELAELGLGTGVTRPASSLFDVPSIRSRIDG